jgi:hypothetical protein
MHVRDKKCTQVLVEKPAKITDILGELGINIIIIISIHEFRPGWPVSVSAVISSSSLLSGRPGRRLPFG